MVVMHAPQNVMRDIIRPCRTVVRLHVNRSMNAPYQQRVMQSLKYVSTLQVKFNSNACQQNLQITLFFCILWYRKCVKFGLICAPCSCRESVKSLNIGVTLSVLCADNYYDGVPYTIAYNEEIYLIAYMSNSMEDQSYTLNFQVPSDAIVLMDTEKTMIHVSILMSVLTEPMIVSILSMECL